MLAGLSFDRERLAEAAADEFGGGDRHRRPPGPQGDAVQGGARRGRRAGPRGARAGQGAVRADAGGAAPPLGPARRLLLRGAALGAMAGVEGARPAAPRRRGSPSSSRRPGPRSRRSGGEHAGCSASRRLERGFFDRSVHDVARDLIGCALLVRRGRRGDRGVRELRARRSRLPRVRRADAANRAPVRPARARLRLPLLRRPLLPQLRLRARGRGGRGADPGAGAALGDRGDVAASRPRSGCASCARGPAS